MYSLHSILESLQKFNIQHYSECKPGHQTSMAKERVSSEATTRANGVQMLWFCRLQGGPGKKHLLPRAFIMFEVK